jgi:hypothetical protein
MTWGTGNSVFGVSEIRVPKHDVDGMEILYMAISKLLNESMEFLKHRKISLDMGFSKIEVKIWGSKSILYTR